MTCTASIDSIRKSYSSYTYYRWKNLNKNRQMYLCCESKTCLRGNNKWLDHTPKIGSKNLTIRVKAACRYLNLVDENQSSTDHQENIRKFCGKCVIPVSKKKVYYNLSHIPLFEYLILLKKKITIKRTHPLLSFLDSLAYPNLC